MSFEEGLLNFITSLLARVKWVKAGDLSRIDLLIITPSYSKNRSIEPHHGNLSFTEVNEDRDLLKRSDTYQQRKQAILSRASNDQCVEMNMLQQAVTLDHVVFVTVTVLMNSTSKDQNLFSGAFTEDRSIIYGDLYDSTQEDDVVFSGFMRENGDFLQGCLSIVDIPRFDVRFEGGFVENSPLYDGCLADNGVPQSNKDNEGDRDRDGMANGAGQLYSLHPSPCIRYEGQFKDNLPHGFGRLYYSSETSQKGQIEYCGYLKKGVFDGKGVFFRNNYGGYIGSVAKVYKVKSLADYCSTAKKADFDRIADSVCWKEGELSEGNVYFHTSVYGTIQFDQGRPIAVWNLRSDGYYYSGEVREVQEGDTRMDCGFLSFTLEGTVMLRSQSDVFFYRYCKGRSVERLDVSSFSGKQCLRIGRSVVLEGDWNEKARLLIDKNDDGTVIFDGQISSLDLNHFPFAFSGNGYFYYNKHRMYRASNHAESPVYKKEAKSGIVVAYYYHPKTETKYWVKMIRPSEYGEEGLFYDGMYVMKGAKRNGKKEGLCTLFKCNEPQLDTLFSSLSLDHAENNLEKVQSAEYSNDQPVSDVRYYNSGMVTVYHQDGSGEIRTNGKLYYRGGMAKRPGGIGFVINGTGTLYYSDSHFITGEWDHGNPIRNQLYEYSKDKRYMRTTIIKSGAQFVPYRCHYCTYQGLEYINQSFDPLCYQVRRIADRKILYEGEVIRREQAGVVSSHLNSWVFIPHGKGKYGNLEGQFDHGSYQQSIVC